MSDFMKIRPLEAQLFHADRWTERHDEVNSPFAQFCKSAPKLFTFNYKVCLINKRTACVSGPCLIHY